MEPTYMVAWWHFDEVFDALVGPSACTRSPCVIRWKGHGTLACIMMVMTLYGLWHVVDALAMKKKPWRVMDMIYEDLRVCNILDPHMMVLEFVSCTGRSPWHIEDHSWVKSTQSCLKLSKYARSAPNMSIRLRYLKLKDKIAGRPIQYLHVGSNL